MTWMDLLGTVGSFFRIGFTGPRLKNNSGNLDVRNAGDSAYVETTLKQLHNTDDQLEINSDAAGSSADWKLTLAKNPAATAHLTIQTPPAKGTDGYFLRQKAGTSAGVLELELAAAAGGTNNVTADTTSLAFGSSSPVTMFTLPANAVIHRITIVVDTAFNGTAPTMSVGVNGGSASKYVAATQVDLKTQGQYIIHPGSAAVGGTEDLEIAYSADSSSAGAARVIVEYSIPS